MVQSTINVVQRGKNTLRLQSARYEKYLSTNARYTNHLFAFWIKVIRNALVGRGFDVVVAVRIAVAGGRDVRTTTDLLDSKENRCRSAILETCRTMIMGACSSSLTKSLTDEGMWR
jgi:hypothetical protein